MVKIIICEDDKNYNEIIKYKIEACMHDIIKEECRIKCFSDIESFSEYYKKNGADIVFMDVMINSENMMNKSMTYTDENDAPVIFMTAFPEAAYNISESNCCYFLLKSKINNESLEKAIRRAMSVKEENNKRTITIRSGNSKHQVNYCDIVYIESFSNNVSVHTKNAGEISVYSSLKNTEEKLPENFLRCHKSYIINMGHITGYKPYCFITDTNEEIPVPLKKYKESVKLYEEFLKNKLK